MPKDVEIGEALAAALTSADTGIIGSVDFTYDPYIDHDRLPKIPVVTISPDSAPFVREARRGGVTYRRDARLLIMMIARGGATDDSYTINELLDAFDALLENVITTEVLTRKVPLSVDYEERYDPEAFQAQRRVFARAFATYANL